MILSHETSIDWGNYYTDIEYRKYVENIIKDKHSSNSKANVANGLNNYFHYKKIEMSDYKKHILIGKLLTVLSLINTEKEYNKIKAKSGYNSYNSYLSDTIGKLIQRRQNRDITFETKALAKILKNSIN